MVGSFRPGMVADQPPDFGLRMRRQPEREGREGDQQHDHRQHGEEERRGADEEVRERALCGAPPGRRRGSCPPGGVMSAASIRMTKTTPHQTGE